MIKNLFDKSGIEEILKFCVGGGSAVIVDFILYFFLKNYINVSMAKTISFVCGAIVGFVINKLWTFKSKKFKFLEIEKYIILYICSITVNTWINKEILDLCHITMVAFLAATGCSTMINFFGQKLFVFWQK